MSSMFKFLMLGTITLLLTCCKTGRKSADTSLPPERTAFYTIEAQRDSVKKLTSFRVIKTQVVDTKVNYHMDEEKAKDPWYLKIEIDNRKAPDVIAYVAHPLFKNVDLFRESGEISSKFLSLPKGQFVIRVPYFEEYKTMTITETVNFKTAVPIRLAHEK